MINSLLDSSDELGVVLCWKWVCRIRIGARFYEGRETEDTKIHTSSPGVIPRSSSASYISWIGFCAVSFSKKRIIPLLDLLPNCCGARMADSNDTIPPPSLFSPLKNRMFVGWLICPLRKARLTRWRSSSRNTASG